MAVTFTQARKSTCSLGELVSFSGGFGPIDTSGLMPFEGTVTVIGGGGTGICWGREVTLSVKKMGSNWLPKMFVKSVSPVDVKTGEMSVNVGCVISLLANKTFDDFKRVEDFLVDPEGKPGKTTRYWWQKWEILEKDENAEEGTSSIKKEVSITSIVQTICSHLGVSCKGGVAGKKRLPYTPSGNVLSEIGNLIFNSDSPSYAYSDGSGSLCIAGLDFSPDGGFSIALGKSELDKDYNPVDGGVEPLKRLIVTYMLKQQDGEECDKTQQRCYTNSTMLPGMTITGNQNDQYEITVETDTTCEWVVCGVSGGAVATFGVGEANVKAIEIKKTARPAYLFPGIPPDIFGASFVDSYYELKNEYYDAEEGLLKGEATIIQEPVGVVYGSWLSSHENWEIEEAGGTGSSNNDFPNNIAIGLNAVYPAVAPSGRAGSPTNKYNTTLTNSSYTETKYFYDDAQVLTGKVTTTWMPISKALPDFNGNSFNGIGEAVARFDAPSGSQFSIEILEKEQWVDLSAITGVPDIKDLTGKMAHFIIYGEGDGKETKAFSGETVITSIITEMWDYSCNGGTKHIVEEKVLKYEYASEIENNLRKKYAEPISTVLNIVTYDKGGKIKSQSKSILTTETPNSFISVPMWGTKQEGFEEYLKQNDLSEYPSVSMGTPIPPDWQLANSSDPDGYTLLYNNKDVIPNFIPRSDLLKLVTKRTITNSSSGGGESPASSEFLSCAVTDSVKWKEVPGAIEVDGFLCSSGLFDPPTEVMDLGEVYDVSYVRKMANTIMKMRQAQSIQYELICKLDSSVCGFPPVKAISVKESCQTGGSMLFIGNNQGFTIGGDEMVVSWDLWMIGGDGGSSSGGSNPSWSRPPADSVVGDLGDGVAVVIAPPPQYVVVDKNYTGNGVITIGSDTLQGTINNTPDYIELPSYSNGTWVTIIKGNDTISSWVKDGKVEVPDDFDGTVTIIAGNDTLTQDVIEVPNRIDLPPGYYPSDNIFIDDTIPASLETDDTVPVFITDPTIIVGDDTLTASWPTIVGVGGIARLKVQTHSDYLKYGLEARKVMIRGD